MIIWLASYPRSGNTLLRMMLRHVFGVSSFSKYNDAGDIAAVPEVAVQVGHEVYRGDWVEVCAHARVDERPIFFKTHDVPEDDSRAIYMVRDGRLACDSTFHYLHDYKRSYASFTLEEVIAGYSPFGSWGAHLDAWQPLNRPQTLLLRYEAMIREPAQAIDEIAAFLQMPALEKWNNQFSALHEAEPRFFRSGVVDPAGLQWSPEQIELFYALHRDWMERLDYPVPGELKQIHGGMRRVLSARLSELFNLNATGGTVDEYRKQAESQHTCIARLNEELSAKDQAIGAQNKLLDEEAQEHRASRMQAARNLRHLRQALRDKVQEADAQQSMLETHRKNAAQFKVSIETIHREPFEWLLAANTPPQPPVTFDPSNESGLVSVIIPVFNATVFLERAVQSVWQQTPVPMELLLCDDGSTDGSLDLCQELVGRSPIPARVLQHPGGANLGVSATRNLGLSAATGQWVALLDADDAWHPGKLARQLQYMVAHMGLDCVCSLGVNKNVSNQVVKGWSGSRFAGDYAHLANSPFSPPYTFEQLLGADPVVNSTLLIRKSAIEAVGGYPRLMAHQAEDWLLLAKLALAQPIALMSEALIDYTVHPGSYTSQFMSYDFAHGARLEFLHHLLHWMAQHEEHKARAEQIYRAEFPRLLGARGKAYRLMEDYFFTKHGNVKDVADFERHLNGVYDELDKLRAFHHAYAPAIVALGKIPGAASTFALSQRWWRRLRDKS